MVFGNENNKMEEKFYFLDSLLIEWNVCLASSPQNFSFPSASLRELSFFFNWITVELSSL